MIIEDIINILNKNWRFKVIAFLVLSFPSFQFYGQLQNILLSLVKPKFNCTQNIIIGKEIIDPNQCTIRNIKTNLTKPCTKWNFSSSPVGKTMVSDYQMVCSHDYFGYVILIVWYLSGLLAPVQGWLSDKYGRKKLVIINLLLETVASILLIVSPNVYMNMVLRLLLGFSTCGVFICFTWLSEMVDYNFRMFVGSFFWLFGCFAFMVFPLIVYFTRDWRSTQGYTIIPSILYLFVLMLPESPRWYYVVGNVKCAMRSLKQISRINKLDRSVKIEASQLQDSTTGYYKSQEKVSFINSFKSSIFLKYFVVSIVLQTSITIFYLGVTMNLTILHSNIFVSMFLNGCMELPSLFVSYLALKFVSRRVSIISLSFIGSVLFLICTHLDQSKIWQSTLRAVLGSLGKIPIATLNQITFVYISEIFPTSRRTLGVILVQLSNLIGFMGALYVNKLEVVAYYLPVLVYTTCLWTSCLVVWLTLPNTRNLPIPDSLEDQQMLKRGDEKKYEEYMKYKKKVSTNVKMVSDSDDEMQPILDESRSFDEE